MLAGEQLDQKIKLGMDALDMPQDERQNLLTKFGDNKQGLLQHVVELYGQSQQPPGPPPEPPPDEPPIELSADDIGW